MSDNTAASVDRRQVVLAAAAAFAAPAIGSSPAAAAPEVEPALRAGRGQPFDFGWKFLQGDGVGLEAPSVDDTAWRSLDLPHDWSIEDLPPQAGTDRVGPFDRSAPGGPATGFTLGGEGWYRKRFRVEGNPARVEILFGGVYNECDVWLNGKHLGQHVYGYTPFAHDLTPHLRSGENVIALRVRNIGLNSRWYSGSGIYRSVTVDVLPDATHVARWGVGVSTRRITEAAAELSIETRIIAPVAGLELVSQIRDDRGVVVARQASTAEPLARQVILLPAPRLWSPETPVLYTLETELRRGGRVIDAVTTTFGVRVVTFDAHVGMRINGTPVRLQGGCVHHDNGLLGAAAHPDADDRRVRLLRARGYNAIRSAHNPSSPSFLAACDRHGMMLIEEAFDTWHAPKKPQDYSVHFQQSWEADLEAMVLQARNHPSVVMWSIGNEVPQRSSPEGVEISWRLANAVRRLDPTRPVTAGVNAFGGRPVIAETGTARPGFAGVADEPAAIFLDVVGYNYKFDRYVADHARFPQRVMYGSESFPKDVFKIWSFAEDHPYMIGDFVWSALDYLGEAGVGNVRRLKSQFALPLIPSWPWTVSNCGDLDLTGGQKPPSRARDVAWGVSPLELVVQRPVPEGMYEHVAMWGWSDEQPSWTWPGAEGQALAVRIYTQADQIELRLNGKVVAQRSVSRGDTLPLEIRVAYAPGRLEATAVRNGRLVARKSLETVGAPAGLRMAPERREGPAQRGRLSYVWVEVADAEGRWTPDAVRKVRLAVSGPARLIGFGSGDPMARGGFQSSEIDTFDGRALAILAAEGQAGTVRLDATAPGLRPASSSLRFI